MCVQLRAKEVSMSPSTVCCPLAVCLALLAPRTALATDGGAQQSTPASIGNTEVSAVDVGAKCDGAADDGPALARAIAAAVQRGTWLLISCKLVVSSGAHRINIPLHFVGNGAFDIHRGASIELSAPLTAPPSRLFYLSGGTLTLHTTVREVAASWWGGDPSGVSDYAPAITAAIGAATSTRDGHPALLLPAGTINIGTTITIRNGNNLRIRGAGNRSTYLKWKGPAGVPVLTLLNCYRTLIEDLSIEGTAPAASELILVQNDNTQADYQLPSSLNVFRDLRLVGGSFAVR